MEINVASGLTESKIGEGLDWAYEKALSGGPGLDSAQDLADDYLDGDGSLREQVDSLIRWQNAKAAGSGFLAGLGGLLALPVTLPANVASVLYVQIRMIAAIAIMGGYDVRNDKVKTLVFACLVANSAKDVLKDVGIAVGNKLAMNAVKQISGETIKQINKAVGFKLLTKFGEKGVVNLGKAIPLLGGLIGGAVDLAATNSVGNVARDTFIK